MAITYRPSEEVVKALETAKWSLKKSKQIIIDEAVKSALAEFLPKK